MLYIYVSIDISIKFIQTRNNEVWKLKREAKTWGILLTGSRTMDLVAYLGKKKIPKLPTKPTKCIDCLLEETFQILNTAEKNPDMIK